MITSFKPDEIPDDVKAQIDAGDEVRCPHWNDKKPNRKSGGYGDWCKRMLFRGEASTKPQEFKCPACGKIVVIQKI